VSITVAELVEIPILRTTIVAGVSGAGNRVNRAHACELEDPWNWLDRGDLLMTNGIGTPKKSAEQVDYVERLADAGVAAVALAGDLAPRLSPEMTRAAERCGLPLLDTAYDVPFSALAQAVADANRGEDGLRLSRTAAIYERLRSAMVEDQDPSALLARLAEDLGCRLEVIDLATRRLAFRPAEPPPAPLEAALAGFGPDGERLPAIARFTTTEGPGIAVPIPSRHPAVLVATSFGRKPPALDLMQHVSAIAALQLERRQGEWLRSFRRESELLDSLLGGEPDASTRRAFDDLGWTGGDLIIMRTDPADRLADRIEDVDFILRSWAVPHLVTRDGDSVLILAPDAGGGLEALVDRIPGEDPIGAVRGIRTADRIPTAAREAGWALTRPARQGRLALYGDTRGRFLPATVPDAELAVAEVLGPLLDYDERNGTELVATLAALLLNLRTPKQAADKVFIHRQTLVYRTRRIEEITGRSLRDPGDISELWLALRSLDSLRGTRLTDGGGGLPNG